MFIMDPESQEGADFIPNLPGGGQDLSDVNTKFIDREEYARLAISNLFLTRWDDPNSSTRGLFDPRTGIRYAIAEGNLFKAN